MKSTFSSPCSRSDPPLFHQGATLAHLDSLPPRDRVVRTDGSVPFPFGKDASGVFCKLFAGLVSTNKSATSLFFSSLTLVLSLPPCLLLYLFFYLDLLWQICWNCPLSPPVLSDNNGSLDTCFLPGNDAANELARRGALLAPSVIPCSLSPLISRIHSRLFSEWRRTVSSKYFDTQVSSIPTGELVLPRQLAVFSLVFAATDTAFC